jgi:hypothetical protein
MADDGEDDAVVEGFASDDGLPWYVKAAIGLVLLIIAFIIVIDLFEFAAAAAA